MHAVQLKSEIQQQGTLGFLRISATMQKSCNNGISSCQFILDNGVVGLVNSQSFPRLGKMKQCFRNALELAISSDLIYCEGYAFGAVIPVLHAWCLDLNGNVIDPTWESGKEYVGVPFDTDYVVAFTDKYAVYDSVIENWRGHWPLLMNPDFQKTFHPEHAKLRQFLTLANSS